MDNKNFSLKTSFPPISNAETEILILGTLPGDRSLQLGEYFAHPRNRFWKIIAAITNNSLPENYAEKLDLLHRTRMEYGTYFIKLTEKAASTQLFKKSNQTTYPLS